MAHAGTPSNLTKQAPTPITGFWRAFIAAILVLAFAAGIVAVSSNVASQTRVVPSTVNSHQIQSQPGLDVHKVVGHKGAMIYQ